MSELREQCAKAAFDSQRHTRGSEYGAVDWDRITGRHRDGWLQIVDAVLGAIEASGRVTVDRARFERLLRAAGRFPSQTAHYLREGDLDPL